MYSNPNIINCGYYSNDWDDYIGFDNKCTGVTNYDLSFEVYLHTHNITLKRPYIIHSNPKIIREFEVQGKT